MPIAPPISNFNPRAPYGARHAAETSKGSAVGFQSTRPIRGATTVIKGKVTDIKHFNPRAPYGARRHTYQTGKHSLCNFNPRAPYGARRSPKYSLVLGRWKFQSTRPIRGATCYPHPDNLSASYFNPRAPYGARLRTRTTLRCLCLFQSTRPIRGATNPFSPIEAIRYYFNPRAPYGARLFGIRPTDNLMGISIHARHTGRDPNFTIL